MIRRTSNPALNENILRNISYQSASTGVMTLQGTINKIGIMMLIVMAGASFTWSKFFNAADPLAGAAAVKGWMAVGGIGGFIMALITSFKKEKAAITAPIYAVFQGVFLGAISAFFESMFPGLILKAVMLTFAVLFALLFAYKSRMIKVTDKFRAGIFAATAGIAMAYFLSFILGMFGINMSFMHGGGTMGLLISLIIVGVAALNLVLDFDFIERGSQSGLPAYMEWYGAFGLMVTLIWLYIEIVKLLSILARRD